MHKIIFSPKAEEDMYAIRNFIAQDNVFYAEKVMQSLFASCMQLAYFPAMGISLSKTKRMFVEPTFRYAVVYKIIGDTVYISTISKYKNMK